MPMKRVLYTMPAVIIWLFYGMLTILAGGIGAFQIRAWLILLLPALAAGLLLAGKWWGSIPGLLLGGALIAMGLPGKSIPFLLAGAAAFAYYLTMGVLCLRDRKQ